MIIYGLKTCDTCRKALKSFPNAEFKDVRSDGVPPEILALALNSFGAKLVNTRSTTWRSLSEHERATPPDSLLAAHPTLMKRPLILADDVLYLGWDNATRSALGVTE